jgi:hypothetical protein
VTRPYRHTLLAWVKRRLEAEKLDAQRFPGARFEQVEGGGRLRYWVQFFIDLNDALCKRGLPRLTIQTGFFFRDMAATIRLGQQIAAIKEIAVSQAEERRAAPARQRAAGARTARRQLLDEQRRQEQALYDKLRKRGMARNEALDEVARRLGVGRDRLARRIKD